MTTSMPVPPRSRAPPTTTPLPPTEDPSAFASLSQATPRLERERSLLLVVDLQAQLVPHVADHEAIVARALTLVATARLLRIPVVASEHCADRIGSLVDPMRALLADDEIVPKTRFGAADHAEFTARIARAGRSQVVVAGIEAHVCVLQTSLGLLNAGYDVFIVADATGSRAARQVDRALALERLRAAGGVLAGTETVLFEWAASGDDPAFREVLARVKRLP